MTLNEGCNLFYPEMSDTNGSLSNGSNANWGTTSSTDIPPSTATTLKSAGGLTPPGFVGGFNDNSLLNDVTKLKLSASSAARRAGCSNTVVDLDYAKRKYFLLNPSMGIYEVTSGNMAAPRTAR